MLTLAHHTHASYNAYLEKKNCKNPKPNIKMQRKKQLLQLEKKQRRT